MGGEDGNAFMPATFKTTAAAFRSHESRKKKRTPLGLKLTRDREKVNMAQVAAQPIWTIAGSPCKQKRASGVMATVRQEDVIAMDVKGGKTARDLRAVSQMRSLTSATIMASEAAWAAGARKVAAAMAAVATAACGGRGGREGAGWEREKPHTEGRGDKYVVSWHPGASDRRNLMQSP